MLAYFRHGFGDYLKENIVACFFVLLLFLIGIVTGALAVKVLPETQKTELVQYLNIFFNALAQQSGEQGAALWGVVWAQVKMALLIWLSGFTIIGIPFIFFLIFTRGFIIGFTVGFLVNAYVFKGLFFALAAVLPHNFLIVPLLVFIGVAAIRFSVRLIRRKNQLGSHLFSDSVNYTILCLAAGCAIAASALVEVYITPVFMRWAASLLV